MNLLFTAYHPIGYGGAEISMSQLAAALQKKKYNVLIASTEPYKNFKTILFKKVKKLPYSLQHYYLSRYFEKIIRKHNIQIIHAHDRLTAIPAIRAAQRTGIKSVIHYRDYWFACPNSTCLQQVAPSLFRRVIDLYKTFHLNHIKPTLNKTNHSIANSGAVKTKLLQWGVTEPISIIHPSRNKINVTLTTQEKKKLKEKYSLKKRILTFSGNMDYSKGVLTIASLVPELANEDVSFLFIGDGPVRNKAETLTQGKAIFTGKLPHEETLKLFALSDAILLPSVWEEPFSGIILEAAHLQKPLIASKVGGIKDLPDNFYIPVSNSLDQNEWKQKIGSFLKNPKLTRAMVRQAKTVATQHEPEQVVQKVEQVYKEDIPSKQELDEFYQEAWESERAERIDEHLMPLDNSFRVRMEVAASMIKPKKEETVILDLGCGIGLYDFYILKKIPNSTILGVDISREQIQLATQLSKKTDANRISFKTMDIEKIKTEDLGGFSKPHYIIATEILEHLVDPRPFLRKVKELCTPKTRLILSVPLVYFNEKGNVWYKQKNGKDALETQDFNEIKKDQKYYRFWHKEYTIDEMLKILDEEGFRVRKTRGGLFRPFKTKNKYIYTAMSKLTFSKHVDHLLNGVTGNKFARNVTIKCSLK